MDTYLFRIEFDGRRILKLQEFETIECIFEAASDKEARAIAVQKWDFENDERRGSKTGRMKRKCVLYKKIVFP